MMITLAPGTSWVTCAQFDDWASAQHRHVLRDGGVTTACGITGLGGVWRKNKAKPECPKCLARLRLDAGQ